MGRFGMKNTKFDREDCAKPIIMALSLDKQRNCERIIIGQINQVDLWQAGVEDATVLFDEERPLGTFLFQHEAQSEDTWNEKVMDLDDSLKFRIRRKKYEDTAWEFLEPELHSGDPVRIFTAYQCWYLYQEYRHRQGGDVYRDDMQTLTRSFKQSLLRTEKACSPEQAWKDIQKSLGRSGSFWDSRIEIWYPGRYRDKEWLIISCSFYPALQYYLKRIQEWNLCFRRCSNCGKMFVAPNRHHTLCSTACHQERNRQNKREFDERAKINRYDIDYKNTSQRMRNRLNKLRKQEGIPEEQRKNAEMNFEEFREEAKRRKKRIKNAEDRRAFRDWLFDQERKFEKICVI